MFDKVVGSVASHLPKTAQELKEKVFKGKKSKPAVRPNGKGMAVVEW
ncbi:hypothetical protein [Sneathiella limimaris]|nr:hypothetical protein [Sneathiella limimaris]